jgi:MFS transporter, DHA2 family, multidrug resistance protein
MMPSSAPLSALPASRRWWSLIALAASVLVIGLDLTVLNLALPTLSRDLHASSSDLQWFSAAYSLVLAAAMLPAGMLGDRFGRKKVLIISLLLFGASSAACAYATSAGELIAFRAILGLGAAAIVPMSLSVLPVLFTDEERPKAIAVIMGATFVAYPVGPLLGGWLLDKFWWGSVFLINVPVVVLAVAAVAALMPESRSAHRSRMDPVGIVASSLGLIGLTYGFIEAGQKGWSNPTALVTMLAGAAVLIAFVLWERRLRRIAEAASEASSGARGPRLPLVDLGLFQSAGFTWGTILTALVSFTLFGILFTMPQYFQEVRGLDALASGVRLLPLIGGMVVGMLVGTRLQSAPKGQPAGDTRANMKTLVTVGFLIMAAGLIIGAFTGVASGAGFVAAWFAVAGVGLGLAMPTASNAALGALTPERSGAGSAVMSAIRQVGATMGVAILGAVLNSSYRSHLDLRALPSAATGAVQSSIAGGIEVAESTKSVALLDMVRSAFVHGLDLMMWICGAIAVACALLAFLFLPRRTEVAPVLGLGTDSGKHPGDEQPRQADGDKHPQRASGRG